MRYQFIKDNRSQFSIGTMCRMLKVSRSGFYSWLDSKKSKRDEDNQRLIVKIREIHTFSHQTYGSRRIHEHLVSVGERCSKNRIARLMAEQDIRAKTRRSFRATTNSKHNFPVAENLLAGQFEVDAPNRVWVSDITYIPTGEGWLYLAAVMDLHSRMIVGWSMDTRMTTKLTIGALEMAIGRRNPAPDLIHHSDRGSQYASYDYQNLLKGHGMLCSMSRKGNCWDNAAMESFFGSLKMECVHHRRYHSRSEARRDIFCYIEVFYNRQRLHSTLGYKTPAQYEMAAAA